MPKSKTRGSIKEHKNRVSLRKKRLTEEFSAKRNIFRKQVEEHQAKMQEQAELLKEQKELNDKEGVKGFSEEE